MGSGLLSEDKLTQLQLQSKGRHGVIPQSEVPKPAKKRLYVKKTVKEVQVFEPVHPNYHKLRIQVMRHFNFYDSKI